MCGIFGTIRPYNLAIDTRKSQKALNLIRHRGPDDEGYLLINYADGSAIHCGGDDTAPGVHVPHINEAAGKPCNMVLAHRRLSIIDLSPLGHQPMSYDDGRFSIVYNGEIYNYLELKEELTRKGHQFRSSSDTEVILAAYKEWRHGMLERFIGMFSLALLDLRERTLLVARDFFGIKPFYYTQAGEQFAFCSEITPLLDLPGVGRRGNSGRLYDYFSSGRTDFGDETLFADIRQLPAAHYAYLNIDTCAAINPVRYWRIDLSERIDISFDGAVAHMRDLFAESVRLHMRSDVPVGFCLSGGLDSSAIVMNMKRLQGSGQQLHTFSFIVDDPEIGEERFVDIIGAAVGAQCHKTAPGAADMLSDMDELIRCQEEPFMSTSVYAQFCVFKLAHQSGIKVMLDGQGADEIFSGYYSLIGARLTSLLLKGEFATALRLLKAAPQNMSAHRLRMVLFSIFRMIPQGVVNAFLPYLGSPSFPAWADQQWFKDQGVAPHFRSYGRGREALREESLAAIECLCLPQLLRYEDRNSMHYSIESRVPFCNPEIARFALSLPDHYLIADNGSTKSVLRESLRGIVPEQIIERPKIGFATPQGEWLKLQADWAHNTFSSAEINSLPFMKQDSFKEISAAMTASSPYQSTTIWRCLNLFYWSRIFKVQWD